MKHYLLFFIAYILITNTAKTQTFTDSNLPIIIINTDKDTYSGKPLEIPDAYKIGATMKIIYHPDGSRNYLTDENNTSYLNYSGRIGIELRGSSSQSLPKKPYGLTTFNADKVTLNNVSILGMPPENDWVLNSLAFDATLIRNYLTYDLSRSIGEYASRCVYCEVVINGTYKGLYMFMEKIKIDAGRVNIKKMVDTDISGADVTGGYIIKADKTTGGDPVGWSMSSYNGTTDFIYESPKSNEITSQQSSYIHLIFNTLQSAATAKNNSLTNGLPALIDFPTFIDYMVINELASNADAYQFSTYFHKDRNGKLRAGPIWDNDLTYGNDLFFWNLDRSHTNVWQFDNGDNTGAKFWKDLYNNPTFKCYLAKRWKELNAPEAPLNYEELTEKIDKIVSLISEAKVRENNAWGTVSTQEQELVKMKTWLKARIEWLNSNLNVTATCSNPEIPPLVITKINYNPTVSQGLTSDDLEFIEITNNGDKTIDLTGIYFRELGITYHFPSASMLGPHDKLYLASNSNAFKEKYGSPPYGVFTRNLSDKSEKLALADAFGNLIDYVQYDSAAPWPVDANGKGYYLELSDINADNSLAASWAASSNIILGIGKNDYGKYVSIYPNPTSSDINIESGEQKIYSYEIFDLRGKKLISGMAVNSNQINISLDEFVPDIYLLKINFKDGESLVRKINKLP